MSIFDKVVRTSVTADVDSKKPEAAEVGKNTMTGALGEGLVSDYAAPGSVGKTLADLAPSYGAPRVPDAGEKAAPHPMWSGVPWAAKKKGDVEAVRPAGNDKKLGNTPAKKKPTSEPTDDKETKKDEGPRLARGSIAPPIDNDMPSLAKPNQGMQTSFLAVNQPAPALDNKTRKRNTSGDVDAEAELDETPSIEDTAPQLEAPTRDRDGETPKKPKKPQAGNGALPDALRSRFERSLGVDLGGVRIHTDGAAAAAATGVGARAYAEGQNIYFADNAYDPSSADGQHLIAHEVAHTVQQADSGDTRVQRKAASAGMTTPGDRFESEADRAADAMVTGRGFSIGEQSGTQIARQSSGEQAFLHALAMIGAFPGEGMVNTQTAKVKAAFPKGAHHLIYYPLYNFMLMRIGRIEGARLFRGNVNALFNARWIGQPCRRQALGIGEDNESVASQISEGKSPAKVALKRAVERKKEADAMDLAPQRANVKALMRSLEKVAQSPFDTTARFEADHMRLQDVGQATLVAPLRSYVKLVLEKFANAVEKRDAKLFPPSLLRHLMGLIGKNGLEQASARARALIARKAKGTTKELRDPAAADPSSNMLESALKVLEVAAKIPRVGPAFKGLIDIVTNTAKTLKDTDPGDILSNLSGLTSGLLDTIVAIVQRTGPDKELGLQAAEQLGVATKFLGYVGSAASAGKHLAQIYSATNARARTDAIVGLLGCVPVIGDALTLSFTALNWLGETFNSIRVASRDVALKEFFFGNTPVAPTNVPALLKAKVRMIRDMPVDVASARRTFAYLDPNPSDPTSSCQDLFAGLDARREWARTARTLHDKYKPGAFTIDGGMDWTSKPGNRTIDQYRVEAANEMKHAAMRFIESKMRELTKVTGATE